MSQSNTQSAGEQVRAGLKGIRGIGDAIRGEAMEATDSLFNTHGGTSDGEAIKQKGIADMQNADNTVGKPTGNAGTSTGAHSGAVGTESSTPATGLVQERNDVSGRY